MNNELSPKIGGIYLLVRPTTLTTIIKINGVWTWTGVLPVSKNEPVLMLEEVKDTNSFGIFLYEEYTCIIQHSSLKEINEDP